MINFSEKYDRKKFQLFLKEFLPEDLLENPEELQVDEDNEYFKKAILLGSVKSLDGLMVIEIERKRSEKSRTTITKELFKFLGTYGYSKALIVTFSERESHYRFSLITSDLIWVGTKVNKEFSNPKRLSFLLGEGVKLHTPHNKLNTKVSNFEDLFSRFNIEVVNDEFFENYKKLFVNLQKKIEKDSIFNKFLKDKNITSDFFSKRLLGQIVFCYFLQKKKWLGVSEEKRFGTGDQNYLRNTFNFYNNKKKNFFNEFLEFFFYEGLNNLNDNNFVKKINIKVPYVGGGLFEYFEGYDWKNETLNIPNSFFSNNSKDGILDIFDLYNFTVDEYEDYDIELAVDPEMLGRVFENLLPENIRKSGGSYYTPRMVVNYMCENSLSQFLYKKFKDFLSQDKIENFIKNRNFNISKEKIFISNADKIDKALQDLKICDPSIGSGAFAVGIVNLVSRLRFLLINHVSRKYKNNLYFFKRDCIQNSIYGVDIDSSAVEIAKLRLWLTLIVEKENYEDTEPLPNLDFQLIQGNSLIDEVDGFNFQHLDIQDKDYQFELVANNAWDEFSKTKEKFINLKKKYLDLKSFKNKKVLREEIENLLPKITDLASSLGGDLKKKPVNYYEIFNKIHSNKNFFLWKLYFIEIFQDSPGFDIIIGNPPYIGESGNKSKFQEVKTASSLRKFYLGKMDYYYFFFHLALNILKDNGILSFITTSYFTTSTAGRNLRKDLKARGSFLELIDFNELKIFKSAQGQHNMITTITKSTESYSCKVIQTSKKGHSSPEQLKSILYKNDKETLYQSIDSNKIFEGNNDYIRLSGNQNSNSDEQNSILDKISLKSKRLDSYFFVKQGVVSGCDKLTKDHIKKFNMNKNLEINDGIFVFDLKNKRDLDVIKNFNALEKKYLRDFYKNSDIQNFTTNIKATKKLLYILWDDNIETLPNIKSHLKRFEKILKNRLVAYNESYPWFSLHRARNLNIFLDSKIVVPYRSKLNTFGYNNIEWFCRSDCYLITTKLNQISLKTLLGILNSKLYYLWLFFRGKRKGKTLELFSTPLSEIPLKIFDHNINKQIEELSDKIINGTSNTNLETENKINDIIYKAYKLNDKEIKFVENFYIEKTT
jgi:adenine-specific DNA-methyltransferase